MATRNFPGKTVERRRQDRRLFLENREEDDAGRAERFREMLLEAGDRCGEVAGPAMISAGIWTVRCVQGHAFRIIFDRDGSRVDLARVDGQASNTVEE